MRYRKSLLSSNVRKTLRILTLKSSSQSRLHVRGASVILNVLADLGRDHCNISTDEEV